MNNGFDAVSKNKFKIINVIINGSLIIFKATNLNGYAKENFDLM